MNKDQLILDYHKFIETFGYSDEGINYLIENKIWITREHVMLKIEDMNTLHLKNSIAMIEDNGMSWRAEWYDSLTEELKKRGE